MKSIYWFRNDLRINDNHSLNLAIDRSDKILFVYIHDIANKRNCSWGFKRVGEHRNLFLSQGLIQLKNQLNKYGHSLNTYVEDPVNILCNLVNKHKIDTIFCESILSFDELKQIELLNKKGLLYAHYGTLHCLTKTSFLLAFSIYLIILLILEKFAWL